MSRQRTPRHVLSLFVAVVLSCWTGLARADGASEARARYDRAVKLYEDGVYDAALVEFTRAYELNPSFRVLYNIGQVRVAMQDYAGAVEAFQQYLRDGGREVPEARLALVQKELARLEQRVARIMVETDIQGAEILIDDLVIGSAPLHGAALVNSGVRRVTVRHPAYLSQTQRVSLAGGEQARVTLNLAGPGGPATPPTALPSVSPVEPRPPSPSPEAPRENVVRTDLSSEQQPAANSRRALLWSAWGATGAIALSALGLGVAAMVKDGALEDLRKQRLDAHGTRPERSAQLADDAQKVDRLALATDVLLGTAIVAASVSLWLTLAGRNDRSEKPRDKRTQLFMHPRGASLRAEF